jgi:membrane protease YdiL (CAAX protease family)
MQRSLSSQRRSVVPPGAFAHLRPGLASLAYLLLSPLFEETLVRAYLMTRLRQLGWSTAAAVALSVAIQTSHHAYQGIPAMLLTAPMFLVFALFFVSVR